VSFKEAVQKHYRKTTVIPKGWATARMVAEELSVSPVRANNILRQMMSDGVAERKRITSYTPEGTGSLAYIYRVIKK
jgi:predicted transcriptional regulator